MKHVCKRVIRRWSPGSRCSPHSHTTYDLREYLPGSHPDLERDFNVEKKGDVGVGGFRGPSCRGCRVLAGVIWHSLKTRFVPPADPALPLSPSSSQSLFLSLPLSHSLSSRFFRTASFCLWSFSSQAENTNVVCTHASIHRKCIKMHKYSACVSERVLHTYIRTCYNACKMYNIHLQAV